MLLSTVMGSIIRADGSPKYAMPTVLIGCVLNVILDYIFVFPLNMGIAGAAWATDIGLLASAVMGLLYILQFKSIHVNRKTMQFSLPTCGRICVLGVSSFINQATTVIVSALVNNLTRKYGALSVYGAEIPITAILSLARQIILFIPLSLILPVFMGLEGVLWAAAAGDCLAFIFAVVFCVLEIRKINSASQAAAV